VRNAKDWDEREAELNLKRKQLELKEMEEMAEEHQEKAWCRR
jgi:hypothetical protein